jgi:hypothetical protein
VVTRRKLLRLLLAATLASSALMMLTPAPASASHCRFAGPQVFRNGHELVATAAIRCASTNHVSVEVQWYRNGRLIDSDFESGRHFARATEDVSCHRGAFFRSVAIFKASSPFTGPVSTVRFGPAGFLC